MTDSLQISEAPSYSDFSVLNYAAADIPAYSIVFADTTNELSVSNPPGTVDGIACKVTSAQTARVMPIGITMELIPGTTKTGGPAGSGTCRGPGGIAKVVATAAVTAGVPVMNDSTGNGTGVAQTAGLPSVGTALTAAVNSGDEIAVQVCPSVNA